MDNKYINWIFDLIFPKRCLGCGHDGSYICSGCLNLISISNSVNCFICGRRSPTGRVCEKCKNKFHPALNGLLVASDWNNLLLRQIIYKYKYSFIKELSRPLSQILITFLETINFKNSLTDNLKTDQLILIPVPLHKRRLQWRGFNQAELIAQRISARLNIPIYNGILERSRYSLPQAEIKNQAERRKNIKDAFKINQEAENNSDDIKNKTILLIDDVCTTSSTFNECAKALKPLKPKEIWGLVIARG